MDTHKQLSLINILFFMIFTCNGMDLTEQHKNNDAQPFIQNFPHMTFAKARTTFNTMQKPIQNIIWEKLKEHDKHNNNKILSVALGLAHLPLEHQSFILTKTNTPSEQLKSTLNTSTIIQLFEKTAKVDQLCEGKNFLSIRLHYKLNTKTLNIPKQFLFNIEHKHLEALKKNGCLTDTELKLLNEFFHELSNDLQNELKNHWHPANHAIQFYCREGRLPMSKKIGIMANDVLCVYKNRLPCTIVPLIIQSLSTHFFLEPTWNNITGSQNPFLLKQNRNFEAANKVIDNLKKLNVDGSEHLVKYTINEVPFIYSWSDWGNFAKPLLTTSFIYQAFIILHDNNTFRNDFFLEYFRPACIPRLFFTIITSPFLYFLSKSTFSKGVPNGLTFLTLTTITGITLGTLIANRFYSYKWKHHSIDFTKDESIEQFLTPEFEIKENLNA